MSQLDERMEEINQANLVLETKVEEVQAKVDKSDDEMVLMQYRSMEFALRIRGLKENNRENLEEICAEALAEVIGVQAEEFSIHIDKVYRVNSWLARQRQLPRDVVIYFTTRKIRNLILQASYKNKIKIEGQEVLMLKEIPPKMLRNRKNFTFLTDELRKRQIQFRRDVPAGIILNYLGE